MPSATVQERDLKTRETELEADRARLDAERKSKEAEQEQIASRVGLLGAGPEREALGQKLAGVEAAKTTV